MGESGELRVLWTIGRGRATVAVVPYSPASSRGSSGGGVSSGTSNPAGPTAGDLFYRTDLQLLIEYDGTRWLTVTQYQTPFVSVLAQSGQAFNAQQAANFDFDMWIEKVMCQVYVAVTNTGAAYWTLTFAKSDTAAVATTLGTVNTSADAPSTRLRKTITVGAALGGSATYPLLYVTNAKTGAPGTIDYVCTLVYRLIVT